MKHSLSWAVALLLLVRLEVIAAFVLPRGDRVPQGFSIHRGKLHQPLARVSASIISSKTDEESPRKAEQSTPTDQKAKTDTKGPTRLRRLKDLVWIRETLEDLTAAEFACSVEAHEGEVPPEGQEQMAQKRRKRAVDYDKLLSQLNRRIQDLGCDFSSQPAPPSNSDKKVEPLTCVLQPEIGMGTTAYSEDQRRLLLERLVRTRQNLMEIIRGYKLDAVEDGVDLPFSISLPDLRVEIPREVDTNASAVGPKLYVRDDGTVDWDGALQDQAALRKFGGAVWARINGRDPELLEGTNSTNGAAPAASGHGAPPSVTARVIETPEISSARAELNSLKTELSKMQADHTALLNSVISAGQAVANVNLASLAPSERSKILKSADALEKMSEKVSYQNLLYELERIYTYLAGELGNPQSTGYISLQDRLNIAEFGLVESQVESFRQQLQLNESIDSDVLAVVTEQVNDFKRRLGIDYFVTGVTFDREAISRWLADLLDQAKAGLAFYVKGVRLFWNDIVFCLNLVSRAAQGYTLKPREVRTIRYVALVLNASLPNFLTPRPLTLVLSMQPDIQGYLDFYSVCYYSDYSSDPRWTCPCLWRYPTILPRILSELLYRTATKSAPALRECRIHRIYHQRVLEGESIKAGSCFLLLCGEWFEINLHKDHKCTEKQYKEKQWVVVS